MYDPSKLKTFFASMGIPYYYESWGIIDAAKQSMLGDAGDEDGDAAEDDDGACTAGGQDEKNDSDSTADTKKKPKVSICSFCARMKRGTLYTLCRRSVTFLVCVTS